MENANRMNDSKKRALAVMLAALFAALILLAVTKFSFISILKGPVHFNMASDFADKQYVSVEVSMDLGPYAEKYKTSDESVTGRYIVAGFGDGLVTVLLSERYFESETVIRKMTADWIDGKSEKLTNYVQTVGTVRRLTDKEKELLDKWADKNSQWMASSGIVSGAEGTSAELSEFVICVDDINGVSAVLVYVLSSIAWVLLAVVLIIGIMWALGKFNGKSDGEPTGESDILSEEESEKAELTEAESGERKEEAPAPDTGIDDGAEQPAKETSENEKTDIESQKQAPESEPETTITDEEETESTEIELKAEEDNIDNV